MTFTDGLFDLPDAHQAELNFNDTDSSMADTDVLNSEYDEPDPDNVYQADLLADRFAEVAAFNAAMNQIRRMADARARGDHADMHNIRHSLTPQQARFVLDYAAGSLLSTRRRQHRDTRRTT
ncbi:hypothetical protein [Corynebacterium glyciniphilum]|uniref:hypothetical protein n=1 Tax=Corynebacterium glyciniphilum TaxID=1404244 RepID=UPI003DA07704